MTTQQIERPLSEVDETAERLQGRTWSDERTEDEPATEDRPSWDTHRALEILRRVVRERRSLLRVAILAVGLAELNRRDLEQAPAASHRRGGAPRSVRARPSTAPERRSRRSRRGCHPSTDSGRALAHEHPPQMDRIRDGRVAVARWFA